MDPYLNDKRSPCDSPQAPTNSPVPVTPVYYMKWQHTENYMQNFQFPLPEITDHSSVSTQLHGHHSSQSVHNESLYGKKPTTLRKSLKFAKVYPTSQHGCRPSVQRSAMELKTIASYFCIEDTPLSLSVAQSQTQDAERIIANKIVVASIGLGAGDKATAADATNHVHKINPNKTPDVPTLNVDIPKQATVKKGNRKLRNRFRASSKVHPCDVVGDKPELMTKERLAEIASMFCVERKDVSSLREPLSSHFEDVHSYCPQRRVCEGEICASKQRKRRNLVTRGIQRLRRAILGM